MLVFEGFGVCNRISIALSGINTNALVSIETKAFVLAVKLKHTTYYVKLT